MTWYDLVTERPVIATMAGASDGIIPRSKIKEYARDDLELIGVDAVEFFIAVIRRIENKSKAPAAVDPETTDQVAASEADGVKGILDRLAPKDKSFHTKKPRVRHPRP